MQTTIYETDPWGLITLTQSDPVISLNSRNPFSNFQILHKDASLPLKYNSQLFWNILVRFQQRYHYILKTRIYLSVYLAKDAYKARLYRSLEL